MFSACADPKAIEGLTWFICYLTSAKHIDFYWSFVTVLALLADINQRLNLTIVLITHQLEVVKTICDHAALLEQGEIVESGKLADLLVTPWSRLRQSLLHDPQAEQEFLTRHGVQGRPLCGVA